MLQVPILEWCNRAICCAWASWQQLEPNPSLLQGLLVAPVSILTFIILRKLLHCTKLQGKSVNFTSVFFSHLSWRCPGEFWRMCNGLNRLCPSWIFFGTLHIIKWWCYFTYFAAITNVCIEPTLYHIFGAWRIRRFKSFAVRPLHVSFLFYLAFCVPSVEHGDLLQRCKMMHFLQTEISHKLYHLATFCYPGLPSFHEFAFDPRQRTSKERDPCPMGPMGGWSTGPWADSSLGHCYSLASFESFVPI